MVKPLRGKGGRLHSGVSVETDFSDIRSYLDYFKAPQRTTHYKAYLRDLAKQVKPPFKKDIQQETKAGGQSTGALHRAVIYTKVWRGKKKKGTTSADQSLGVAVGPMFRYKEIIRERDDLRPGSRKKFRTEIHKRIHKGVKKKTVTEKVSRGPLVGTKRLRKRKGQDHQVARPFKYWHLVEFGFTHKATGKKTIKYMFMNQASKLYVPKAVNAAQKKVIKEILSGARKPRARKGRVK